jgi:hypothetical protein
MLEYYKWSGHVGHQLEVKPGVREYVLGDEEREEKEETITVQCLTCDAKVDEYGHEVAIRWNVEDVQSLAKLSLGEAEVVLEELEHEHDATVGINWDTMESMISHLFPDAERADTGDEDES